MFTELSKNSILFPNNTENLDSLNLVTTPLLTRYSWLEFYLIFVSIPQLVLNIINAVFTINSHVDLSYMFTKLSLNSLSLSPSHLLSSFLFQFLSADAPGRNNCHRSSSDNLWAINFLFVCLKMTSF